MIPKLVKPQTLNDVVPLVGAVALTVLGVIIVTALYVGREILVPVALAILTGMRNAVNAKTATTAIEP